MTIHSKPDASSEVLPEWRLDDLFGGREDPRIEADLAEAERFNAALVALKGAFVGARADPPRLGRLIAEGVGLYEQATNKLWAVGAYASLAASVGARRSRLGQVRGRYPRAHHRRSAPRPCSSPWS